MNSSINRAKSGVIAELMLDYPVVCIVGPRQCGKTTLAKSLVADDSEAIYLDMESPRDLAKLQEAELFFEQNEGRRIIIDEVQRRPDLFPVLRAVVDRDRRPGRFLITGSASPELLQQGSESLAGRIAIEELTPLTLKEACGSVPVNDLWLRGGYPDSLLARSAVVSQRWRKDFVRTYIDRDLPMLGLRTESMKFSTFIALLASQQGQLTNKEALGRLAKCSADTIARYLFFLEQSFLLRTLQPFSPNVQKRLVKSPKQYFRDSGLLHTICDIADLNALLGSPLSGGSWEGFVIEQVCAILPDGVDPYFYRTHDGAEADLVLVRNQQPVATLEMKLTTSPNMSKGYGEVIKDLKTERNFVIIPGSDRFPIDEKVDAVGLETFIDMIPEFIPA